MENQHTEEVLRSMVVKKEIDICAIITARGGSKRVPHKNIRDFCGKPLIFHTIEAAINSSFVDQVYVSTDDAVISAVSKSYGAEVIVRPKDLATDNALSKDAVRHVLDTLEKGNKLPDLFILLQPTSPFRSSGHIDRCIDQFLESDGNSSVSVTPVEHHPYKMVCVNDSGYMYSFMNDFTHNDKPHQSLPQIYRPNGALYLASCSDFLEHDSFFIPPVLPFIMSNSDSVDIDTEMDIAFAELLKSRGREDGC